MKLKRSELDSMIKESIESYIKESGYEPTEQELNEIWDQFKSIGQAALTAGRSAYAQGERTAKLKKAKSEIASLSMRVSSIADSLSGLHLPHSVTAGLKNAMHDLVDVATAIDPETVSKAGVAPTRPEPVEPGRDTSGSAGVATALRGSRMGMRESIRQAVKETVQEQLKLKK